MTSDDDFRAQLAADPTDRHTRLVYADWLDDRDRAREAAVQRVLAEPADDAHRLAFAAVCEREGDAARAEFVRVQVEIARLDDLAFAGGTEKHHARKSLVFNRRAERLWRYCGVFSAMLAEPGPFGFLHLGDHTGPVTGIYGTVRRGFVEEVTCLAEFWGVQGDAICSRQPVRLARLITDPSGLDWWDHGARMMRGGICHDRWPGVAFDVRFASSVINYAHAAQQVGLAMGVQWLAEATGLAPGTVTYDGHEPPAQSADGSFEVARNFTVGPG